MTRRSIISFDLNLNNFTLILDTKKIFIKISIYENIIIYSYEAIMKKIIEILNALSNEKRLQLFLVLLEGNFCVCELQEILNMEQSRLSHQLAILRYQGLLESRQEGRWIIYSVPEEIRDNPIVQSIKESIELSPPEREKISRVRAQNVRGTDNEELRKAGNQ